MSSIATRHYRSRSCLMISGQIRGAVENQEVSIRINPVLGLVQTTIKDLLCLYMGMLRPILIGHVDSLDRIPRAVK